MDLKGTKEFNKWVDVRNAHLTVEELERLNFAPWFHIPSTDEWRLKVTKKILPGFSDYRFEQFREGIPIDNSEVVVHVGLDGSVQRMNGTFATNPTVMNPKLTWAQCASKAVTEFNATTSPREYGRIYGARKIIDGTEGLKYVQWDVEEPLTDAALVLCYEMLLESKGTEEFFGDAQFVFVDAQSGNILRKANALRGTNCNQASALTLFNGVRTITTRWRGFPYYDYVTIDDCRGDGIFSWEPGPSGWRPTNDTDNEWSAYEERPMTSALWAGEMTYDYWWNIHGRNSWNADGGMLRIHARDNANGNTYSAFWDDAIEVIRCGTGGGDGYQYAFVGLEHIGHEFAHGMSGMECGWSTSSSMESQALDEGFSDAFGVMVDFEAVGNDANYLLGENNGLSGGAARDMANPNSKNMPDTYLGTHWSLSTDARQAKYVNMGVVNYWYYLLVEGGTGINDNAVEYDVEGIGRHNAARILYRAMYAYLGSSSQFADAKNATIYSAMDLYGACSFEVVQTINAWNAVGVESSLGFGANLNVDCGPLLATHNAGTEVTRRAIDILRADCDISANYTAVSFFAGQAVELIPGFNSGDRFLAQIDPCMAQAKSLPVSNVGTADVEPLAQDRTSDDVGVLQDPMFGFGVWPNPSNGLLAVRLKSGLFEKYGKWSIEVVSPLGVPIVWDDVAGDETLVDLRSRSGIFLLYVRQGARQAVERIVIEP